MLKWSVEFREIISLVESHCIQFDFLQAPLLSQNRFALPGSEALAYTALLYYIPIDLVLKVGNTFFYKVGVLFWENIFLFFIFYCYLNNPAT